MSKNYLNKLDNSSNLKDELNNDNLNNTNCEDKLDEVYNSNHIKYDNEIVEYDIKETQIDNNETNENDSNKNIDIRKKSLDNNEAINIKPLNLTSKPITISNNNLYEFEGRYCIDCDIDIILRSKHCGVCGCIATFDHHCNWICNCIGEKNKKYFIYYLLFTVFLLFHSILLLFDSFCIENILINDNNIDNNNKICDIFAVLKDFLLVKQNLIVYIILLILSLALVFVFTLLKFQLNLIINNQTTWENYCWHKIPYIKDTTKSNKSPFNISLMKNIKYVFCYKKILINSKTNYINWKDIIREKYKK